MFRKKTTLLDFRLDIFNNNIFNKINLEEINLNKK